MKNVVTLCAVVTAFSIALVQGGISARADSPITVTYTATGYAGNWTYDFTLTNNLAPNVNNYDLFIAGPVPLAWAGSPSGPAIGSYSPSLWDYHQNFGPYPYVNNNVDLFNVEFAYISSPNLYSGLPGGNSQSGFEVVDNSLAPETTLAFDVASNLGNGQFFAGQLGTAGIYGTATLTSVSTVPLPAALPLFGVAVAGFVAWGRRRAKMHVAA
jgi:hypothetical protein